MAQPRTVDEITAECKEKMNNAIARVREDFGGVRTGRASAGLVERLHVDYYGAMTPLQQLATFSVPEARVLVISPFDKQAIKGIEKAIQESDLGVNPSNDGIIIRLSFPQLTEERRKELVKVIKGKAEDGRVNVRNLRRHARQELEASEKAGALSKDDLERAEKELEKVTTDHVAEIDRMVSHKEKELLEV